MPIPGMRLTKAGRLVWVKPGHVRPETPIPERTLENLAACGAVGLHYWSDAPPPSTVWAVHDDQTAHLVRLHRNQGVANHLSECRLGCRLPELRESWRPEAPSATGVEQIKSGETL